MTDKEKQLKHHEAEIDRLNRSLPQLQQRREQAMATLSNSRVSHAGPLSEAMHEDLNAYGLATSAIDEHKRQVLTLRREIQWEQGVSTSSAAIKAGRKEMDRIGEELSKLQTKRGKLVGKLDKLKADSQQETSLAEDAQRKAAKRYAEAMSSGDEAAEQQALAEMDRASQALESKVQGGSRQAVLMSALSSEIEGIDGATKDAAERLEATRRSLLQAIRYKWAARLNEASEQLADIAANLYAAEKALGMQNPLDELKLPLQTPGGLSYRGASHVREAAALISLDQLAVA